MSYFNAELGVPCSLDPEGKVRKRHTERNSDSDRDRN